MIFTTGKIVTQMRATNNFYSATMISNIEPPKFFKRGINYEDLRPFEPCHVMSPQNAISRQMNVYVYVANPEKRDFKIKPPTAILESWVKFHTSWSIIFANPSICSPTTTTTSFGGSKLPPRASGQDVSLGHQRPGGIKAKGKSHGSTWRLRV